MMWKLIGLKLHKSAFSLVIKHSNTSFNTLISGCTGISIKEALHTTFNQSRHNKISVLFAIYLIGHYEDSKGLNTFLFLLALQRRN